MHYSSSERSNGSEVRVRRDVSGWFAGFAGLGFVLGLGIVASAQTTANTPAPATAPATAPAAAPVPTAEGPDKIKSMPGYRQQPSSAQRTEGVSAAASAVQTNPQAVPQAAPAAQAAPIPQKAPAPVVTPAPPTAQVPYTALPAYGNPDHSDTEGSAYIPVDSWVYPAMLRLYSLGYLDTMYLAVRPYTRRSALHMLQASEDAILSSDDTRRRRFWRRC